MERFDFDLVLLVFTGVWLALATFYAVLYCIRRYRISETPNAMRWLSAAALILFGSGSVVYVVLTT